MEQRSFSYMTLKYTVYAVALILLFGIGERTSLLPFGIKSIPVIGLFVSIAMVENELIGGIFGLIAGILCDGASALVFGVASALFLIMGCAAGLLSMYLINPRPKSAMLLTGAFALIYGIIVHYSLYGIWGYEGAFMLLLKGTLPSVFLTSLWGFLLFFAVSRFHNFVELKLS